MLRYCLRAKPALAFVLASLFVLVSRVSFLPPSLEDFDSVNFSLGLAEFDPLRHQPHPPGYAVFILLGKLLRAVCASDTVALALLSALAQAALVQPLFVLLARLSGDTRTTSLASLLVLVNPVLWFNGVRPMSDSLGLLAAVSTQALLLRQVPSRRMLLLSSFLVGLGCGVRLQVGLLTLPLWLYRLSRTTGGRLAAGAAGLLGVALWLAPTCG
jgi:4-amino-4-deoxy-L-arabinose transferase-like glycosyltransferase